MEITQDVLQLGAIASQTLLYPMQPQRMTQAELDAVVGAHFGFDLLAGHLYPEMARILERFGGGKIDASLKLKLQGWLAGWVNPPDHYVVHHPVYASGQWWRVFRTTMFVQRDHDEAVAAARTMTPEELEVRYAQILGPAARDRYASHAEWWAMVLATIRMGSWHIAIYSPRYQAFISPYLMDAEGAGGNPLKDLHAEWSKPMFRLYASEGTPGPAMFVFSRMIERSAFIEVLGELMPAPPFGDPWGPGVGQTNPGNSQGWVITGVMLAWDDEAGIPHRRVFRVTDGYEMDHVVVDGADPFRFVQALHAVTGWLPKGVNPDHMAPERLGDFVAESAQLLGGTSGLDPFLVPKQVFLDAVLSHPGLMPVYGRVISLLV